MSFFLNIGYHFLIQPSVKPDGSLILCSAMPMHQLERRHFDSRYPHLNQRLFDPQLYMAGLDANESPKHCTYLASYPWFGATGIQEYKSKELSQSDWKRITQKKIQSIWPKRPPVDINGIRQSIEDCIEFQVRLGCWGIILPSPLTVDQGTDYSYELSWLDSGLEYLRSTDIDLPVFATVALSDVCVRYMDPSENRLLDLILDVVSAREIDGVYLLIEQGSERAETRYMGNSRALASALHLVHIFSRDCNLQVGVNFFGPFGLALEAAGADFWVSDWYKSLVRFRIADKLAGGRAYPLYWSYPTAVDVHLDNDFDTLRSNMLLNKISDITEASQGFISAAQKGKDVSDVPAWRYAQSNVASSMEHYRLSLIQAERLHSKYANSERLDFVESWLRKADNISDEIINTLGYSGQTHLEHVQAWLEAFMAYRIDHRI